MSSWANLPYAHGLKYHWAQDELTFSMCNFYFFWRTQAVKRAAPVPLRTPSVTAAELGCGTVLARAGTLSAERAQWYTTLSFISSSRCACPVTGTWSVGTHRAAVHPDPRSSLNPTNAKPAKVNLTERKTAWDMVAASPTSAPVRM